MLNDQSTSSAPEKDGALAKPRILVVEDDFLIRLMLVEVLEDDGFDTVEADNGDEALAILDATIAAVVTDFQLPGPLNGHEWVALARQSRPGLPAIYTSGRGARDAPQGDRDLSIAKPYQGPEICAAVRRMLAV
jgi:CheY-like chemotaxis protein